MQPSTLDDLSSCAVNACGARYGARAAYQLGESHDSISHGDNAGFTWTSIIEPYHLSGLVFEIVAVWASKCFILLNCYQDCYQP